MTQRSVPATRPGSAVLSVVAIVIALASAAYYVADSITGRDTNLAEQLRVLGFCPDATAAEISKELGDCPKAVTFDAMNGDLVPSLDDVFSLGTSQFRWHDLQLGPGTLFLQDAVTGDQVAINVIDGALLLDGADSLRIGNIRLTATGLESVVQGQDITIGNFGDSGYLLVAKGIKFPDGSRMTSATQRGGIGTSGPRGLTGATGSVGAIGPVGPTGAIGSAGARGATGTPGTPGANGATGPRGEQGIPGSAGVSGAPGADGLDGGSTLSVWNADGSSAIDLTKQVITLGSGSWTLANGSEGQVLYFVSATGSDASTLHIIVSNLRYQNGSVTTHAVNWDWHPFAHTSGGTRFNLITMAVFFGGSWNVSGGELH